MENLQDGRFCATMVSYKEEHHRLVVFIDKNSAGCGREENKA